MGHVIPRLILLSKQHLTECRMKLRNHLGQCILKQLMVVDWAIWPLQFLQTTWAFCPSSTYMVSLIVRGKYRIFGTSYGYSKY